MRPEKRSHFHLTGGFHTLSIKSNDLPTGCENVNGVDSVHISSDKKMATMKLNPNKYNGDIFTFDEFREVFSEMMERIGVNQCRIIRADLRLDNYDPDHYMAFQKLNRYIISALALAYNVKNTYRALELFTDNQISISIKSDYFECENYDRDQKNRVTDNTDEPAQARLEERTMARQWRNYYNGAFVGADENLARLHYEFTHGWEARWQQAIDKLDEVQQTYNDILATQYVNGQHSYPVQFRSLTDFLIARQNSIFTSRQMINLLERLGVPKPEERAKYHKKEYGIEYFSKADVEYAVSEIKRATAAYFEGEKG